MTFKVNVLEFYKSLKNSSIIQSYNLRSIQTRTAASICSGQLILETISPEFSLQEVINIQSINNFEVSFDFEVNILSDFISTVEDEFVELVILDDSIKLKTGRRKFEQKIYRNRNSLTLRSHNNLVNTYPRTILDKMQGLCFAITTQSYSLALNALFLESRPHGLEATATNGYILSRELINGIVFNKDKLLVPKNGIECAFKIFKEEFINIRDSSDYISFSNENSFLQIRCLELEYINTSSILPKSYKYSIQFEKTAIHSFMILLNKLTRTEVSIVEIEVLDNICTIRTNRSSNIQAEQSFEVNCSKDINVSFNGKLLCEVLNSCNGEILTFSFNNELSPFSLMSKTNDCNKESIILPIRL